jgi:4-amino-4-deoxy-L-arabinose transferase-like glycosyltransferase
LGTEINVKHIFWFIVAFLLVYAAGLSIDVINIDAAQYAAMSRQMAESGNWLQIKCGGNDYLDKPPLLFWLSALSFKIFGIHNWSYKFPSFLFAILGIYSTKKLGELLYDVKTGMTAALMLASSLGVLIMVNDTRTDTILLGSVIFATWQILLFLKTKRFINLLAGFFGVGLAMLAKGPIGMVIPVFALSCDFIYKRQWKNFFRWQWLVGLVIVAVILFPMCYGLYEQYDLHPEKVVNDAKGVSGLKFYFWTQSFGRITGDSAWGTKFDNGAGPFFFTHTFLWAFFPWSILVVGGILKTLLVLIKSKFRKGFLPEFLSVGGFILTFVALSASRYKLPHYIYVTLPLASIIAARFFVHDILNPERKIFRITWRVLEWIFVVATVIISWAILFVFFPEAHLIILLVALIGFLAIPFFIWKMKECFQKLMYPLLAGLLSTYFIVNTHFYPHLMPYQTSGGVGKRIAEEKIPADKVFFADDVYQFTLDFYSGYNLKSISPDSATIHTALKQKGEIFIYTDESGWNMIHEIKGIRTSPKQLDDYSVQFLTMNFLVQSTREPVLRKRFFIKISEE